MTAAVQQLKQEQLKHEGCVELLRSLLAQAESGELTALYVISELRGKEYTYDTCGLTCDKTLGLLQRATFKVNQIWDEANES